MDNLSLTEQDAAEPAHVPGNLRSPVHRRRWWRPLALAGVVAALVAVAGDRAWQAGPPRPRRPRRRR